MKKLGLNIIYFLSFPAIMAVILILIFDYSVLRGVVTALVSGVLYNVYCGFLRNIPLVIKKDRIIIGSDYY
jgi:hypothetical protein